MDLSAFSNDNFDAKDWINSTFQLPEAKENKEAYSSTLVMKLQLFIQEVNNALEVTSQQVMQVIPRIVRELDAMREEALLLKEQMKTVKDDITKVEHDSTKSMKTLLLIDSVKSRMQEATKSLKEADNWSTLSADVEDVFQTGDINAIAARLVGMQNSLEILVHVPNYAERFQRLENLKNRLEAMLSPQLIAAFNSKSLELSQMYVKIFLDIKRLPQLQKYYHNCQKNQLLEQWRLIVESDPEETFSDWISNFHDILLSTWHSQMNWCSQVFLDLPTVQILCELIVDVLSSLDPSLSSCIETAFKEHSCPLLYLIDLKQTVDRFAKSLEVAIQGISSDHLKSDNVATLAQSLYASYRPFIDEYSILEENLLLSNLCSLSVTSEEIMDAVHNLGDSVSKVLYLCQEADNRCQQLTHGCGYPGLIIALKMLYRQYAEQHKMVLNELKSIKKKQDHAKIDDNDWTLFQHALHILQITGEVLLQLENLEANLINNIKETAQKLGYTIEAGVNKLEQSSLGEKKSPNPFHAYDELLLSPAKKRELRKLFLKLCDAEDFRVLDDSFKIFRSLCAEIGKLVFDVVFDKIWTHIQEIPSLQVWSTENPAGVLMSDLPAFSFSPQEYITQIGQYIMTLPQHIEPFVLQDNPALVTALKHEQLPYTKPNDCVDHVADYLLSCIARGTLQIYFEAILKIPHLTSYANNQLITDIGYVCDVLDDLGLSPSDNLGNLLLLLKASSRDYAKTAQGKPEHLVKTVKAMRKL
ncbi:conserved oligomeric Golgi complex subunit 7 [Centruroides vittatus]|uniref:conserved oligomeric Golgi complex subunit 7 n=1 Tax=Centruroides vittatus TaxID=120091 RepID=UPI00350F62E1